MIIAQTKDTISLNNRVFPSRFLLDRGFPALPEGMNARYYNPEKGQFWMSDGQTQQSAGSIPWEEGEDFLAQSEALADELQQQQIQQSPIELNSSFHPDRFLINASQSALYNLGKNSEGQARIEFEEVREIINGRLLFIPEAISSGGLLQKNLQELVGALGEIPENAIAEFNQLLEKDLGVEWKIEWAVQGSNL